MKKLLTINVMLLVLGAALIELGPAGEFSAEAALCCEDNPPPGCPPWCPPPPDPPPAR